MLLLETWEFLWLSHTLVPRNMRTKVVYSSIGWWYKGLNLCLPQNLISVIIENTYCFPQSYQGNANNQLGLQKFIIPTALWLLSQLLWPHTDFGPIPNRSQPTTTSLPSVIPNQVTLATVEGLSTEGGGYESRQPNYGTPLTLNWKKEVAVTMVTGGRPALLQDIYGRNSPLTLCTTWFVTALKVANPLQDAQMPGEQIEADLGLDLYVCFIHSMAELHLHSGEIYFNAWPLWKTRTGQDILQLSNTRWDPEQWANTC